MIDLVKWKKFVHNGWSLGSYSLNIVYLWRDELFPFISNSKYRFKILLLFVKISFSIFFHASRKIWKINREETNTFIKEFQSFLRVKKNFEFQSWRSVRTTTPKNDLSIAGPSTSFPWTDDTFVFAVCDPRGSKNVPTSVDSY